MTQPNPDPITAEIISNRMNASLNPKGITAEVKRDGTILKVVFTTAAPNQKGLVEYARRAISSLKLPDVKAVIVYGLRSGERQPDWKERIELMVEPEPSAAVEIENAATKPKRPTAKETVGNVAILAATGAGILLISNWIFSACSAFFTFTEGEKSAIECRNNFHKKGRLNLATIEYCREYGEGIDRQNQNNGRR